MDTNSSPVRSLFCSELPLWRMKQIIWLCLLCMALTFSVKRFLLTPKAQMPDKVTIAVGEQICRSVSGQPATFETAERIVLPGPQGDARFGESWEMICATAGDRYEILFQPSTKNVFFIVRMPRTEIPKIATSKEVISVREARWWAETYMQRLGIPVENMHILREGHQIRHESPFSWEFVYTRLQGKTGCHAININIDSSDGSLSALTN